MERLNTFDQMHAKMSHAAKMRAVSDDAFRQSLTSWYLSPKLFGPFPSDPFSPEFKAYQLDVYQRLAEQTYEVTNEETEFDFEQELKRPYPYGTLSANTVGSSLMGYGWVIKTMDLPAGARILEIGSGYGALTEHLAQTGYDVTCLDISASLLKFVQARNQDPVKTICGDMATVEINGRFEAIIFNASLHHTLEHKAVIGRLESLLEPGGKVVFTAEPVVPKRSKFVPYPWGVRLDGLSVWTINKWGWMELGFQQSYFIRLLSDAGWHLNRYNIGVASSTDVWIGTRDKQRTSRLMVNSKLWGYGLDLDNLLVNLTRKVANVLK